MAWFAELAGKAEHILTNLDEQSGDGAAPRPRIAMKSKKRAPAALPAAELAPPDPWAKKKRPIPRSGTSSRRRTNIPESTSNYGVPKKQSVPATLRPREGSLGAKKSPSKTYNLNILNRCSSNRHRNSSLINTFEANSRDILYNQVENIQKLTENALLKNELKIMSKANAGYIAKLGKTEEELRKANDKIEKHDTKYAEIRKEKQIMHDQLQSLKTQLRDFTTNEYQNYKNQKRKMEADNTVLRDKIKELEEKIARLNQNREEQETKYLELENQLQVAKNDLSTLQNDLEKMKEECKRIETNWEIYKLRVKSILNGKDKEIQALQQGLKLSPDTKTLMSQIDNLKAERSMLSQAIVRVRGEYEDMKQYMQTLESRHETAERVVIALRDALRDERAARNRAETQASSLTKELKSVQIGMGQTIAGLRSALREKDHELARLASSSVTDAVRTSSACSALNVADYEVTRDTDSCADRDKVSSLTQLLMRKQNQIDELIAANRKMKMGMEKYEKYEKPKNTSDESELSSERSRKDKKHASVVRFQDESLSRGVAAPEPGMLACRIGSLLRAVPFPRLCIVIYMVFLQIWVVTVMLNNSKVYSKHPFMPHLDNEET